MNGRTDLNGIYEDSRHYPRPNSTLLSAHHTSLLIEVGIGIKEIQQRLGHTYPHTINSNKWIEKTFIKFNELMRNLL